MAEPLSMTGLAVGVVSLGIGVCSGLLRCYGSIRDEDRSDKNVATVHRSTDGESVSEIPNPPGPRDEICRPLSLSFG